MSEPGSRQDDILKDVLALLQREAPSIEAECREGFELELGRLEAILAAAGVRLPEERLRFIGKALLCLFLFEKEDLRLCADVLKLKGFFAENEEICFDPFDRLHTAYAHCICRGKAPDASDLRDGDFRLLCALTRLWQRRSVEGGAEAEPVLNAGADASLKAEADSPEQRAESASASEEAEVSRKTERAEAPEDGPEEGGEVFSWSPLPGEEFFREHAPSQVRFFGRPLVWEKPSGAEPESGGGWDEVLILLLRLLTDKNRCGRYCSEQRISLPKLFLDDADFRSRRFGGMVRQDRLNSLIKSEHNFRRPEYICGEAVLERAAPHRDKWELLLKILDFLQVENEEIVIKYVKIHADN